jgi:hypothetical protein
VSQHAEAKSENRENRVEVRIGTSVISYSAPSIILLAAFIILKLLLPLQNHLVVFQVPYFHVVAATITPALIMLNEMFLVVQKVAFLWRP